MTVITTASVTEGADVSELSCEESGQTGKEDGQDNTNKKTFLSLKPQPVFTGIGPTLGVLTSSTMKFCSRGHTV